MPAGPRSRVAPLVVLLSFLPLAQAGLTARFAFDDMMNMAGYWRRGWPALITAQFQFWSSYYRPMGGLFYQPLLDVFGLDPLPYRVVIAVFLTANALLAYYAATLLTRSLIISVLTGVLTAYHSRMLMLHYNTSQVYDVLCFFFWFVSLILFLQVRSKGRFLGAGSIAALSIAYICCLNSKEMGVTLPLMLLAWEVIHWERSHVLRRSLPIVVTGLLTLIYVVGKMMGPDPISGWPGYKPVFTVGRFLDNNGHFAADILYLETALDKAGLLLLWAGIAYLVFRRRRLWMRWALALIIFGALPISFSPARGAQCLPIPLFGFALVVSTVAADVIRFLSREPLLGRRNLRAPARIAICLTVIVWHQSRMLREQQKHLPEVRNAQDVTWLGIQEMQRVRQQIRRGSRIAIVKDPGLDWEMYFVTELVLRDRSAVITLQQTHDHILTPQEIAGYDHVLTFDDNNVLQVLR